jgi:iron complex outermembrane recepter protein
MSTNPVKVDGALRRLSQGLLFAGASFLSLSPALAQDAAPASSDTLETVRSSVDGQDVIIVTAPHYVPTGSVTANKTDIPLIETPQSISVVTRDQIELLSVINVQQAVRYSSGVVGENYGPDLRFDFLTVRGFTPKQYIDGLQAPITTTIFNVGADLYGFEAVDILKGPSSVLYGNVPPGGIYNLTSRRAREDFGGEIGVKVGTDQYYQANTTVTGAVADGLNARFTGLFLDRGSQVDHVHAQRIYVAPTFTWNLGPATSLTGLAYYQYDDVKGDTNGFLPAVGTIFPNPLGQIKRSTNLGEPGYNRYKRTQYSLGYDFKHEFSDAFSFEQNVKWTGYREDQKVIYSGGLLDANFDGVPDDYRTVTRNSFPYHETVYGFAADNRLSAKFETGAIKQKILVGVDYRNIKNHALFGFGFGTGGNIDIFNPVYNAIGPITTPDLLFNFNFQRVKQTGIYGQDQIGLGNFYITLGGRYDWVKLDDLAASSTTKQHKFTWRAGANYVFDNGFAPYISYATAFEPVLGTDTTTGRPYRPSTANQIEGGIKYDARGLGDDVKLFATLAAYKITQKNLVATQNGLTPVSGVQVGEVEAKGGEFEIVTRIRDQLAINASYSYTDTKVTKSVNGDLGDPLPTTPKHKLSGLVDYTFQQGALGGLGFGFGARYLSKSAGSLVGGFNPVVIYTKSTTLFDAILHYDLPEWRFAINGSNIFDKKYVGRCSNPSNCIYGQARQIIGTITRKF